MLLTAMPSIQARYPASNASRVILRSKIDRLLGKDSLREASAAKLTGFPVDGELP